MGLGIKFSGNGRSFMVQKYVFGMLLYNMLLQIKLTGFTN